MSDQTDPLDEALRKQDFIPLVAARDALDERIAKGETMVADLLAKTDAENPEYQRQRAFLNDLKNMRDDLDYSLYQVWKETNARIWCALPKKLEGLPLVVGKYPFDGGAFKPHKLYRTDKYIIMPLTWYEYSKFIGPLLEMELERGCISVSGQIFEGR